MPKKLKPISAKELSESPRMLAHALEKARERKRIVDKLNEVPVRSIRRISKKELKREQEDAAMAEIFRKHHFEPMERLIAEATGVLPPAVKFDAEKPRWDLLPFDAIEQIVKVLGHGAKKYADRNWERGTLYSRYYAAALRHLAAWWQNGEEMDPESGLPHLAHAATCLLFLLAWRTRGLAGETDDRPRGVCLHSLQDKYKDGARIACHECDEEEKRRQPNPMGEMVGKFLAHNRKKPK